MNHTWITMTLSSFLRFRTVIRAKKEKITVEVQVKNSKDNAYNTKVLVSFSKNINYVKIEVRICGCLQRLQ